MKTTNPHYSDFLKGIDSANVDLAGMGFAASRDKFNMDFEQGKRISDPAQLAWANGYFKALCDHPNSGI